MKPYIKESLKFVSHMGVCVAAAIATQAGISVWQYVLEPKFIDMVDKDKPSRKIGFTSD